MVYRSDAKKKKSATCGNSREYEDLRRPFAVTAEVPYTDVWSFPTASTYPGKHPCEKPAALLEHIISASTRPGAVVLDCFAGSGSTLAAAQKLGRVPIGIEIDPHWVTQARHRLGGFSNHPEMNTAPIIPPIARGRTTPETPQHQQLSLLG